MKVLESVILMSAIIGGVSWTIMSTKDGFKQNNATIVARSIDIASTIDGEIENDQLAVGTPIQANDMMVKIRNSRVDRSRVTELKTKVSYLKMEVKNAQKEKAGLKKMLAGYVKQSASYSKWLLNDLKLKNDVTMHQHQVAKKEKLLRIQEVQRTQTLVKKRVISQVELQTARTKVEIADNKVKASKAELRRNKLTINSIKKRNIFFESGDASYWQKTIDTLKLRIMDNDNKIAELQAQLAQYSEQENVELSRLNTDFVEVHRAPFSGVVNAVYGTKGSHIKAGTTLMQVLDCSNPIVIVPIPESHFSDFIIGQKVMINPIDSEQTLSGKIKYISSGPLISLNKTIAMQEDLVAKGNHAVITFDKNKLKDDFTSSCDTARRAIVTIQTHTLYDKINEWVSAFLKEKDFDLALNDSVLDFHVKENPKKLSIK